MERVLDHSDAHMVTRLPASQDTALRSAKVKVGTSVSRGGGAKRSTRSPGQLRANKSVAVSDVRAVIKPQSAAERRLNKPQQWCINAASNTIYNRLTTRWCRRGSAATRRSTAAWEIWLFGGGATGPGAVVVMC